MKNITTFVQKSMQALAGPRTGRWFVKQSVVFNVISHNNKGVPVRSVVPVKTNIRCERAWYRKT